MNINLTSKLDNIPQETKDYAVDKSQKLKKYYILRKVEILMDMEGEKYKVEIVVSPEKGGTIVAQSSAEEWLGAIDSTIDKVERQLRRLKDKVKSHRLKKHKGDRETSHREEEETYEDVVDKMKSK